MLSKKVSRTGSIIAFAVSALFIAAAAWIFINRQFVLDQLAVWSYAPSSAVQTIENEVGFTDKGRFIFYATRPSVEQQDSFNKECPRQEVGSPIVGCYTNDGHIYIYSITNQELSGMEEVTAAHEMLHAVWARTNKADQDKLSTELKDAYNKLDNPELKKRMDYYERTEPGEFVNELHSILGTEIGSLGEPLESYYSQFFNRQAVLTLHQKYYSVYQALYNRADELYTKMQALATTIQSENEQYNAAANQLTTDINSFNTRAKNGDFNSRSQFDSERAALVARSSALDVKRQSVNADIATYNSDYKEYQSIAQQVEVLNNSVDSFKKIEQGPSV